MQDFAFLMALYEDGTTVTLWSGEPRHMMSIEEAIDGGTIGSEGYYIVGLAMKSTVPGGPGIPFWVAGDIYHVFFNHHGELIYRLGFKQSEPTVNPRRIHRWPH